MNRSRGSRATWQWKIKSRDSVITAVRRTSDTFPDGLTQAVKEEFNPYSPAATVGTTTAIGSRWRALPSFVTGFFGGTALQWVLFWTDSLDTEFPPMGGAVLGVIAVLAFRYPRLRDQSSFLLLGAIIGNLNAFWCNKAPLLYWDIPRDIVSSWVLASITFVLTLVCTFALAKLTEWMVVLWLSSRTQT